MRKTLLYLVILAVLGFGIYFFLLKKTDSPYSADEAGFTIKDTGAIGKIYIVTNDGDAVLVERTDSAWMVNKKYRALPSMLNLLMGTLAQQTALYPVTKNAFDNVIKSMSTDGIKTEIYGRDGKKMRVFYVGGTAVNNTGTNMLMDGAHTPYVVQVQGFDGYLTPRFTTNIKDWRDRTVFSMPAEEIKTISVQYADKPINSFVVNNDNGTINVKADPEIMNHLDSINQRKAHIYIKYFTNVNCEGYLNGVAGMDSAISKAPKQSTIDIVGLHGQHQHADIYWMGLNKRSKNVTQSDPDVPDDYDADRLYAVINNGQDTVMVQQQAFKKIFRKAFEFYQKDMQLSPEQQKEYEHEKEQSKNVLFHKKV